MNALAQHYLERINDHLKKPYGDSLHIVDVLCRQVDDSLDRAQLLRFQGKNTEALEQVDEAERCLRAVREFIEP